jgi:hypothetical protein
MRLEVAKLDDDNKLYGELSIADGEGTIRLVQVLDGTTTFLTDAMPVQDTYAQLNDRHRLALCWMPGEAQGG